MRSKYIALVVHENFGFIPMIDGVTASDCENRMTPVLESLSLSSESNQFKYRKKSRSNPPMNTKCSVSWAIIT